MAKWSRLENVLTPFAKAKLAYDKGNLEEAQSFAKRGTEMIDAMVKMAQLKQQIDMAPYEVEYKQALSADALQRARESGQRADTGQFKLEQDRKAQEALGPAADALAKRFNLDRNEVYNIMVSGQDVGKISKDFGSMYQTQEDIKAGVFPAEAYKATQEAREKGTIAEQAITQKRPETGVAFDVEKNIVGREFERPSAQAETESKQGKAKYDMEKGLQAKPYVQAEITDMLQTGGSTTAIQPINMADKARDNINAIERQETNIYNALTRLDQLYQSGESDIFQKFISVMPSEAGKAPNVAGQDAQTQYNALKRYYTGQLSPLSQQKKPWLDLEKQELSKIVDIPEPAKSMPAIPMHVSSQRWDSMREADKNGYRSYRAGVLIDTPTGAIPVSEYEKRKTQTPTTTQTAKPATKTTPKQEQPQKTGNTNTEKKASSLEEWKKRRDKQ